MTTYHIIKTKYENENTAEYGYGDFPVYTDYSAFTVEADTPRKAMNAAKKIDARLSFGGRFGNSVFAASDLPSYIKAA